MERREERRSRDEARRSQDPSYQRRSQDSQDTTMIDGTIRNTDGRRFNSRAQTETDMKQEMIVMIILSR